MNIFITALNSLISKIHSLFYPQKIKAREQLTEHGNIVIQDDPYQGIYKAMCQINQSLSSLPVQALIEAMQDLDESIKHYQSRNGRVKHLAKHARKRRVRKKNRHRLSKYESRRQ